MGELKLSESLTSAEEPWHHPPTIHYCNHTLHHTTMRPYSTLSHHTSLDPTALHHPILSRWVLSESLSSPETGHRPKSSQTPLLERINFLLTPSPTHHTKAYPKISSFNNRTALNEVHDSSPPLLLCTIKSFSIIQMHFVVAPY